MKSLVRYFPEREGGREKALRIRSLAAGTGVRHEGECNKKLGLN